MLKKRKTREKQSHTDSLNKTEQLQREGKKYPFFQTFACLKAVWKVWEDWKTDTVMTDLFWFQCK